MSTINQEGDWAEKLPLIKTIIDEIKKQLKENPAMFKTLELLIKDLMLYFKQLIKQIMIMIIIIYQIII